MKSKKTNQNFPILMQNAVIFNQMAAFFNTCWNKNTYLHLHTPIYTYLKWPFKKITQKQTLDFDFLLFP